MGPDKPPKQAEQPDAAHLSIVHKELSRQLLMDMMGGGRSATLLSQTPRKPASAVTGTTLLRAGNA